MMRIGSMMNSNDPEQAIVCFRKYVNSMAVCGVMVLLFTTLAREK
jgi:hypothetical protein